VSKMDDVKARIQGKKTAAELFIETGLNSNQREEEIQNADTDLNNPHNQIDIKVLRQKVKQQSAKKKTTRFEDEHKKLTVWVKNDAFEILQVLAANKKGEKTRIVTESLMEYARKYMKE
jgi:hypothetical protein